MDRSGGCCIAPAASVYDMSNVEYIMLRYRPIAPKPAAPPSVPPPSLRFRRLGEVPGGRAARTDIRPPESARDAPRAVTLPFLPEKPERRGSPASGVMIGEGGGGHVTGRVPASGAVGTWVVVEDVRDGVWGPDGWDSGRTDKERVMNLARDTCPGFLSDGLNRVTWANAAYREMVGHSGGAAVVMGGGRGGAADHGGGVHVQGEGGHVRRQV
ncbi:hypothetical protein DM860_009322 [Cuscuta australis]|uniref:DUF7950 domain-containing protein n=1 Tax=Cuscuta australis TaxID=267555 RepID=A0A328DAR9_9ASTE|nr:hypothetical protein DM860_009322 [Cuscuta australis]